MDTLKNKGTVVTGAASGIGKAIAKLAHEKDATILDVLAASYAAQGDFASAQRWEGKAILAGEPDDIPQFQRRLVYYQANKPWSEDSK